MSGGSLDYVYQDVERAVEYGGVRDEEAKEVVRDIVELLHDIEWSASGDYGRDQWRDSLEEFCEKWGENNEQQ